SQPALHRVYRYPLNLTCCNVEWLLFFFSSRRRHTRSLRDWSSDVCSSDLRTGNLWETEHGPRGGDELNIIQKGKNYGWPVIAHRSEERRVGKECRSRWAPYH